jgi:hypothetical protein
VGDLPGLYWFRIVKGEDFDRIMTYFDTDGVTPVDLTGYTASFEIDLFDQVIISVTQSSGITLGGNLGTIRIKIPHETFDAAEPFKTAHYALFLDPSDNNFCLLEGQFSQESGT